MDYLKEKHAQLQKALIKWKEALDAPFSDLNRDAAIQRYEFTFELLWKTVKIYLKEQEGINCASPKSCMREMRLILDISEEDVEICLMMANDRNLSVHTYSEEMSNKLYNKLGKYLEISEKVSEKIHNRIA